MKQVKSILTTGILALPLVTFASSMSVQTQEGLAMLSYFLLIGLTLMVGFFLYRRSASINHAINKNKEKFRYKTFELVEHGKKIIFVKRYQIPR